MPRARIGTHYFASFAAAVRYYRAYGFTRADVGAKRARGEIVCGIEPPTKAGELLWLHPEEGRYFIVT